MISSAMQARYKQAVVPILSFLIDMQLAISSWDALDEMVAAWVEHAYAEGEQKSLVSNGLAGLQFFLPRTVGRLKLSWKLAKIWQRLEPPLRVLPLSPLLVRGFAGAAVYMGFVAEAAALLIGFDCMLRSGELYNLKIGDITFLQNKAVLCLGQSKSGKRSGTSEMVVVESALAMTWLKKACRQAKKGEKLLFRGDRFFRKLFYELVQFFEVQGLLTVYSLRRGGATWNFLHHGSMEKTLLRGRWSSTSTARIYLQDATATVSHLQLTQAQRSQLLTASNNLTAEARQVK